MSLPWVNPLSPALVLLGVGLTLSGEDELAEAASGEGAAVVEASGHPLWLWGVRLWAAMGHALGGRVEEARAAAERCLDLERASGIRVVVTGPALIRSWAVAAADPGPVALAQLRAELDACAAEGVTFWRPFYLSLLADACLRAGRWDEAVVAADEGLAHCQASGDRIGEAELHRQRGLALAAMGGACAGEGVVSLRRAVAVAEAQGATLLQRRAVESLAHVMEPATP